MAVQTTATSNAKQLTECPTTLKEAIDWILRMSEKDKNGAQAHSGNTTELGKKVEELLKPVLNDLNEKAKSNPHDVKLIQDQKSLEAAIKLFTGYELNGKKNDANWSSVGNEQNKQRCASIFLSCIPLIFSGLSYLYWQCNKSDGSYGQRKPGSKTSENTPDPRWYDQSIKNNGETSLGIYLTCCGYTSNVLNGKRQSKEIKHLLDGSKSGGGVTCDGFKEFKEARKGLLNESATSQNADQYTLACLHLCSAYYFQYKHQENQRNTKCDYRPTSIREMLYWLTGLPYSPVYTRLHKDGFDTALNGKNASDIIPFTVSNFDDYLLTPCFYSGFVLMAIEGQLQGSVADESLLHDVYSNEDFQFYYPNSASAWFGMLWDVVYAVIIQLNFLKSQCQNCGARLSNRLYANARLEQRRTPAKTVMRKKLCIAKHKECGIGANCSPLQAYLCDKLDGFKCEINDTSSAYDEHTKHVSHRSQWCHIPMGFGNYLSGLCRSGNFLHKIMEHYLADNINYVSIYGMVLVLQCTVLRTPHTLGDLFTIFYELVEAYDNTGERNLSGTGGGKTVKRALEETIKAHPGEHTANSKGDIHLIGALEKLQSQQHMRGGKHESLYSLRACDTHNCGRYLIPLSWNIYKALTKENLEVYFSWILYLAEYFKEYMKMFLDAYKNVDCSKSGCKCAGQGKCQPGTHGNARTCRCENIVHCAGVLTVFYGFGFAYQSVRALNKAIWHVDKRCPKGTLAAWLKRDYSQFSVQLNDVIYGKPFDNVIEAVINSFYTIRSALVIYLATFWHVVMISHIWSTTSIGLTTHSVALEIGILT
ncbi:uncharacterized protein BXIN_2496 [Babesia sp. Xinjiang]|uniref:uncharacterized protein n=1 Tax=Babesia sp. Xinjiang TaxID=462227 RepID=UPI000A263D9F|nr:uncharacterized protein BXIN_2496 [Babesia sp. Xinjiang]ORM41386.1 hypothetical protein BXIN_2496 [Babesia sp. Xinjiang]